MKTIALEGIIGFEVLASDIRDQFDKAEDKEIDLIIHSPGGSVYEGIAIYNTIKDFRKNGGKVNARVIGLAASMASYIPLAADSVSVEDNAVWMIHNPWSFAIGDQRDMRKTADLLEGLSGVMAKAYVKKTGKKTSEIREMMDAETYLFGDEIKTAGFADEITPAGEGAEDKEAALLFAQMSLTEMQKKLQTEPEKEQLERAVAMITDEKLPIGKTGVSGEGKTAAQGGDKLQEEVESMELTLDILRKEYSALYDEAVQAGVKQERERRNALKAQALADPDNADMQAVIEDAIEKGIAANDLALQTRINVAVRNGKKMEGENPPSVATADPVDPLSDKDLQAAKIAGLTPEEYRKYSKEV